MNVGLCLTVAERGGGCSGVPAGVLLMFLIPVLIGALLGMFFRAWRGLRAVDLRTLGGWYSPKQAIRWAYAVGLLAIGWSNLSGLMMMARAIGHAFMNPAGLASMLYTYGPFLLIVLLTGWRVVNLLLDRDALWAPKSLATRIGVGVGFVWLQVATIYFPFSALGLGTIGWLSSMIGFAFFLVGVVLIELSRYERFLVERRGAADQPDFPPTQPVTDR